MTLGSIAFLYCAYKKLFFTCSPLLIVFLNSALLSHAYLEPGWLITGDANAHVARVAHLIKADQEGVFSGWSNFFYGGTPVLQFYSPLFFQLSALLGQFIDSSHWSIKIILFTCNIVSAIGVYYFLRCLRLPAAAAIIGALIYAGSFAHIHLVLFRGMFASTDFYVDTLAFLLCKSVRSAFPKEKIFICAFADLNPFCNDGNAYYISILYLCAFGIVSLLEI